MLTVINSEFDLGDVKKNTIAVHNITVNNTSNAEVVVNPIGTSCGCTTGVCRPNPVKSGTQSTVEISFNPNKVGSGSMVKSGVISWNVNGKYHSHNFKFKVNVI